MYVELLDGRYAGKMRDIESAAALDLIRQGRAKRAFSEPTPAAPVGSGAYRGTAPANDPSPEVPTVNTAEPLIHAEAPGMHKNPSPVHTEAESRKKKHR